MQKGRLKLIFRRPFDFRLLYSGEPALFAKYDV